MKELSIEEKAKRYDEAIRKARRYYDEYKTRDNILYVEDMEDMFPELKESENERFSKILSDILLIDSDEIREILDANNVLMQDIDAWLEKQDIKVSVYKDTLFKIATILSQYEDKDNSPLEKIRSIMIDGTICSMDLEIKKENQGEHKPTDDEMKILLQTEYEKGRADAIEQKSAWSEEDEGMLNSFLHKLEVCNLLSNKENVWAVRKLKSLKERYTWKPSDEQIEALEFIVHFHTFATKDTREKM